MLRINRLGVVTTPRRSNNQCKDRGHRSYRYHVIISTDNNLNADGFIIKHEIVHDTIKELFQKQISSCEIMVAKMFDALRQMCKKHDVAFVDIYIKLRPVIKDKLAAAYVEYSFSDHFRH